MAKWLVTRHQQAAAWLLAQGMVVDKVVTHLEPADLAPGDDVIGILPLHLIAQVCANGGRFFSLDLQVPPELRGQELDLAQMTACGAAITEYVVMKQ